MKHLIKTLCALIYASAFIYIGLYTNHSVQVTRIGEARAEVDRAKYEAQAAQFNAINKYWSIEASRTETEKAIKRAVFAEARLQKVCVRMKGRC